MVPIAPGKPLLEHIVEELRDQGVEELILSLHYFPETITSYFGDGKKFGVHIHYTDERKALLGTGGAIRKAAPLLDEEFLALYGDELHFFDFRALYTMRKKTGGIATIVLKRSDIPQNGDVAEFNPLTGEITQWHARPHEIVSLGDGIALNDGIKILSKKILSYIPETEDVPAHLDGQILPRAMAAGEKLYGFLSNDPILDIGTPEKYEIAKRYYEGVVGA